MSTQLQQVLQRLHLVAPSGQTYRPRARLLAVLNVLAGAILHESMERGCVHGVAALAQQSGKGRRTVQTALREAQQCGLVRIAEVRVPVLGQQSSRYWLDKRLCDAAELPRPYSGAALLYMAPSEAPAKQGGDTDARAERAYKQHKTQRKHMIQPPQTGVQLLHPDYKDPAPLAVKQACLRRPGGARGGLGFCIPPPPAVSAPGVPLPQRGGGAGAIEIGINLQKDQFAFFAFFENLQIEVDFQSRLIKGQRAGQRGGRLCAALCGDLAIGTGSAETALQRLFSMERYLTKRGKKRLEGVVHAVGEHPILLIDDLDSDRVKNLKKWWVGALMIIETSPENHQAFLRAPGVLTHAQRTDIQRALSAKFCGDDNAVNGSQMHRYPGSINHKNGGSWCTSLVLLREPVHDRDRGDAQLAELLEQQQVDKQPVSRQSARLTAGTAGTEDASRAAFGYACRALRGGAAREAIAAHIAANYNLLDKHSSGQDGGMKWARRTVANAARKAG